MLEFNGKVFLYDKREVATVDTSQGFYTVKDITGREIMDCNLHRVWLKMKEVNWRSYIGSKEQWKAPRCISNKKIGYARWDRWES
jgi:hypothetical protein